MRTLKLSGLAAAALAFSLGACSKTTYENPTPSASTGATVTTTTTARVDTTAARKDSTVGYQASGTAATTSTTVTTASPAVTTTTPSTTVTATTPTTTVTTSMPSGTMSMPAGTSMNGAKTLQLSALNNSSFTGTVTLADLGNKTRVALTLNAPANTNASADHNASLRTGTCAAPGAKVVGLSDVEGNGKASNTEIDYRMAQLTDGQHIVVVNENPGDRAIACAAISR